MPKPARREELESWIAGSQRLQRKLALATGVGFAIAVGLAIWNATVGGAAMALVALVAIAGFWVTASHIADWRNRLAVLDVKVPPTGSRRWTQ
jgi:hypothetical protein